jgi:hypothetical protein
MFLCLVAAQAATPVGGPHAEVKVVLSALGTVDYVFYDKLVYTN